MPEAAAQQAIQALRRRLLALDARAAGELVRAYLPVAESIERGVARLFLQMEGKQLSFAQVQRLQRYDALLSQVERQVNRYAVIANGNITQSQRAALGLAQSGTQGVVNAALPLGIDMPLLARVGIEWNVLPTSAFEAMVGISGDGAPLGDLLSRYGPEAKARMVGTLREGVGLGFSPRKTAANIRRDTGIPLSDALRISRTETNRAYREGTRMQYEANPEIVKGYKRIARRSPTTCFACIALDGTRYETNEPLDEHPNGKCAMVPVALSYSDLGLDIPETRRELPTARDWFRGQPESVQMKMMGPAKFEGWKAGKFELEDMAKKVPNRTWGPSQVEKPARELVS
jgi:hypothetical protein